VILAELARLPLKQAMVSNRRSPIISISILAVCGVLCSCAGGAPSSPSPPNTQGFSCPSGQSDVMQYFVMSKQNRESQFVNGQQNPIYTQVFPDEDFAASGYWFWLKSVSAHGFDVKAFDRNYVYIRSTELVWDDNTTFKRSVHDLPIAARCVAPNASGPEIQVADTAFQYFSSCSPYKSNNLGTALNDLDAPVLMDTGGNLGQLPTRVLHYRYNCDSAFQNCSNEEQFFLASGYGLWQWEHYQNGMIVNSTLINNIEPGTSSGTLPCTQSYQ
jgi:hypothetical protein